MGAGLVTVTLPVTLNAEALPTRLLGARRENCTVYVTSVVVGAAAAGSARWPSSCAAASARLDRLALLLTFQVYLHACSSRSADARHVQASTLLHCMHALGNGGRADRAQAHG